MPVISQYDTFACSGRCLAYLNACVRWVLVSAENEQGGEVAGLYNRKCVIIVGSNFAMAFRVSRETNILDDVVRSGAVWRWLAGELDAQNTDMSISCIW